MYQDSEGNSSRVMVLYPILFFMISACISTLVVRQHHLEERNQTTSKNHVIYEADIEPVDPLSPSPFIKRISDLVATLLKNHNLIFELHLFDDPDMVRTEVVARGLMKRLKSDFRAVELYSWPARRHHDKLLILHSE